MQVYGGVVYMSCRPKAMEDGVGTYELLQEDRVPQMWLMYAGSPSCSGRMHAPVRRRWEDGEAAIVDGLKAIAELADTARCVPRRLGGGAQFRPRRA